MPRANRNIVSFPPNVPQQIALKSDGLPSASGEHVRFDLVDGRALLLDLESAKRLADLEVNLEEPFWICLKWAGTPEDPQYLDMWLDPIGEKRRAREEAPELERQLRESISWVGKRNARKGPASAPRPVSVQTNAPEPPSSSPLLDFEEMLILQTNTLTDAYAQALKHAGEKHGLSHVKPEDIRTFLVTAYINCAPRGAKRNAA